jgi:hypothetical protein
MKGGNMGKKSLKKNSKFLKMDMALMGPCGFCLTNERDGVMWVGVTPNLLAYLQSHKKDFGGVYYIPVKKEEADEFRKMIRRKRR